MEKTKKQKGFTLIELIIALAVFAFAIVAIVDIFSLGMGGVRRVFGQQNAADAMRYILESTAKELRMSYVNTSVGGPYDSINITNADNETIDYAFDNINKQISRAGQTLNPNEVEVTGGFYVQQFGIGKPRVTMVMKVVSQGAVAAHRAEINLQTTISSRQYAQ